MRVLVADDHESVRKGLCKILELRGDIETCAEASDGEEAVCLMRELNPDLVILDLSMPRCTGFEAAQKIRELSPDTPILFFSIHETPELIAHAERIGVLGFIRKTDPAANVLKAVDAALRKITSYPTDR
ncbi:MAG: response regulator transcription factor [Candidatus Acidiferrales bacterium]